MEGLLKERRLKAGGETVEGETVDGRMRDNLSLYLCR